VQWHVGSFPRLWRDWRIRTLVPVIVIHIVAFAALYALVDHFASRNLLTTHKFGAAILLDEIESKFEEMMVDHSGPQLWPRIARLAQKHDMISLNVFDGNGRPVYTMNRGATRSEVVDARRALTSEGRRTVWSSNEGSRILLFGARAVNNGPACRNCHAGTEVRLGVIQVGVDLTAPLSTARARARRHLAVIFAVWMVLFAIMAYIRAVVIGRPLRQIESSIAEAGLHESPAHTRDLESLASNLHVALWDLIRRQKDREETIARQLVRAERLASLGEIAAGLTHEIKNPLAGVIAALDLLRTDALADPQSREVCDQMIAELRRVTTTVDSLLRLGRPQPPQLVPVDLRRLAGELVSLFSARFRRLGVALEFECADSLPVVPLDAGLVSQLLINLLTNSLQASDRGSVVRVLLAPFPRRDGVLLAVADTGRGISPEQLDKVFDPFFTTKEEGTGLGLAICRQIAEQHGGTIGIESEAGKGTRVVVLLPKPQSAEREVADGALAAG
jgi:signal transduction histidine kinase